MFGPFERLTFVFRSSNRALTKEQGLLVTTLPPPLIERMNSLYALAKTAARATLVVKAFDCMGDLEAVWKHDRTIFIACWLPGRHLIHYAVDKMRPAELMR